MASELNVGGITTTGNSTFSGDIQISETEAGTWRPSGYLKFYGTNSGSNVISKSQIRTIAGSSSSNAGIVIVEVKDGLGSMQERLRIDGDGGLATFSAGINVSAGNVTLPAQPAFSITKTNQDNIAINSWIPVTWETEIFDQGGNFASNTFTAPVAGRYQLNVQMRLDNIDSAADYYQIKIETSNRNYYNTIDPDFGQDATYWTLEISILADMDASDIATIEIKQGAGTAQTDISGASSFFSGFLAC